VPCEAGDELAEAVALRVLDLPAKEGGGEFVRLVADDQVVAVVQRGEFLLNGLVARELVETGDGEIVFDEPVAGARGLELIVGQDFERQVEAAREFVLPLLGEAAGADHEATSEVAACDQLLDEEPGHDRLAGARVVGQEEPQRLARQHRLVDRGDLVRQRIDERSMDGQDWIEEVGQSDAMRFGDEAKQRAFAVEAPGAALFDHLEAGFIVAVENLVGDAASWIPIYESQRIGAVPLHANDRDGGIGENAADGCAGGQVFQSHVTQQSFEKYLFVLLCRLFLRPILCSAFADEC
jgi:hypothetical protein